MMYIFEYFIYHLKPYGITSKLVLPLDLSRVKDGHSAAPGHNQNKTQTDTENMEVKSNLKDLSSNQNLHDIAAYQQAANQIPSFKEGTTLDRAQSKPTVKVEKTKNIIPPVVENNEILPKVKRKMKDIS